MAPPKRLKSDYPCPICKGEVWERNKSRREDPTTCCSKRCGRFKAAQKYGTIARLTVAATAARVREARTEVEQWVQQHYGSLSDRERELFNHGVKIGHERGYNRGYHAQKRKLAAA